MFPLSNVVPSLDYVIQPERLMLGSERLTSQMPRWTGLGVSKSMVSFRGLLFFPRHDVCLVTHTYTGCGLGEDRIIRIQGILHNSV